MQKKIILLLLCISNYSFAMEEENPLQAINHELRMMALQKSELEPELFGWLFPKVEALTKNPDINATDDLGNTRMHYAALLGLFPIIKQLITVGADPALQNAKGQDILSVIDEIIKLANNASLREKYQQIYQNIVFMLLEQRPNIRFKNNSTLLHVAIQMQDLALIKKMLTQKIDPNLQDDFGNTPLNNVIDYVDRDEGREIIHALLKAKAQPDIANTELETPLHRLIQRYFSRKNINPPAVNLKLINLMEKLFTLTKNKNVQNKMGDTPLYILAASLTDTIVDDKMYLLIKTMLEQGVNPNIQNKEGFTPLHAAVLAHDVEVVKLLLDHGANPFIRTFLPRTHKQIQEKALPIPGKTALEIAIELRGTPGIPLMPVIQIETMLKNAQRVSAPVLPKLEEAKPAAAALIKELETLTKKLQEIQTIK